LVTQSNASAGNSTVGGIPYAIQMSWSES
jgi:hypothetical protein